MSVRVVTVATTCACGMAGAGGAAWRRRRAALRRRQDIRLQLLRRHPWRRSHPERPVGRRHHPDPRQRADPVRAAAARHAQGQRRGGLRLGARHSDRALLQRRPHRRAELPRLGLRACRSPIAISPAAARHAPSVGAHDAADRRSRLRSTPPRRRPATDATRQLAFMRTYGWIAATPCSARRCGFAPREQQPLVEQADAHQHQRRDR